MRDIEKTLNRLFVDLFTRILNLEENYIQDQHIKLTMGEVHLLESIDKSEEKTVGSVAKVYGVTLGTATVGIDKLVKKGFVTKTKDEKDKRIVRVNLTQIGKTALMIHDDFHREMIGNIIHDLELASQEELVRSLENVVDYFESKFDTE
ncbi:MAG: MarR family winged helix-turn-helix transcriptional regulator [Erysipelotrichaceae bacterium]